MPPVCLHAMWDGLRGDDVPHPYMRDTAHVAGTGVTGEATQWIGGGSHLHSCLLQPLNHTRPAGRIRKSAMHEHDGERPSSAGGCLSHEHSFLGCLSTNQSMGSLTD